MATEVFIASQPQRKIYGLWGESGDKTAAADIPSLSGRFYKAAGKEPETVLPFFVLSKDYSQETGRFKLFIGSEIDSEKLESFILPEGLYGKIIVRPKLGFIWGAAIGEAKRHFYAKWLPASEYSAMNMEYEYHTERSVGRKPEIDLYFAVEEKRMP